VGGSLLPVLFLRNLKNRQHIIGKRTGFERIGPNITPGILD
jgi:hypothetical protein